MAKSPTIATVEAAEAAPANESVKVVVTETTPSEPKLSAKTLAEQEAGRAALAAHAARK